MIESSGRSGVRGRLLVIDDESCFGETVERVLAVENDVTKVGSALEALDRILGGQRFDVIFCDVMMLRMTGVEFVERLRMTNLEQADRVVFITGGFHPSYLRERLNRLPNACLEKPIDLRELRTFVRRRVHAPQIGRSPPERVRGEDGGSESA